MFNYKDKCRDVFDYFSTSGIVLTYNELYQALLALGITMTSEEQKEKEMEYMSSNENTKGWSKEEFFELCETKCFEFKKSKEDIINEFKKFDKDDLGYLTKEKLRKIFYDAQIELHKNEIELILDVADIKNNNKIDYYVMSDAILSFYDKENV